MVTDMLGEKLKQLRNRKNLTQDEVSRILDINRARYTQYETGTRKPDYEMLVRLAEFYDTSVDNLLGRNSYTTDLKNDMYKVNCENLFKVPIVGLIRCGQPIFAEQNIEGYMYVDNSIVKVNRQETLFYLRVTGDSMAPKFQPGDLVLIRQQTIIDDGEIAVVLIDNEEATLKKVFSSNGTIWLHSLNPAYEPTKFPAEKVCILGKALLRVGTV
jgi:repressor LexA